MSMLVRATSFSSSQSSQEVRTLGELEPFDEKKGEKALQERDAEERERQAPEVGRHDTLLVVTDTAYAVQRFDVFEIPYCNDVMVSLFPERIVLYDRKTDEITQRHKAERVIRIAVLVEERLYGLDDKGALHIWDLTKKKHLSAITRPNDEEIVDIASLGDKLLVKTSKDFYSYAQ